MGARDTITHTMVKCLEWNQIRGEYFGASRIKEHTKEKTAIIQTLKRGGKLDRKELAELVECKRVIKEVLKEGMEISN